RFSRDWSSDVCSSDLLTFSYSSRSELHVCAGLLVAAIRTDRGDGMRERGAGNGSSPRLQRTEGGRGGEGAGATSRCARCGRQRRSEGRRVGKGGRGEG